MTAVAFSQHGQRLRAMASIVSRVCPRPENGAQASTGMDDGVLRVDTNIKSSIDSMATPANAGCSQGRGKDLPMGNGSVRNTWFTMGREKGKSAR